MNFLKPMIKNLVRHRKDLVGANYWNVTRIIALELNTKDRKFSLRTKFTEPELGKPSDSAANSGFCSSAVFCEGSTEVTLELQILESAWVPERSQLKREAEAPFSFSLHTRRHTHVCTGVAAYLQQAEDGAPDSSCAESVLFQCIHCSFHVCVTVARCGWWCWW
jgi:hypothetical protein